MAYSNQYGCIHNELRIRNVSGSMQFGNSGCQASAHSVDQAEVGQQYFPFKVQFALKRFRVRCFVDSELCSRAWFAEVIKETYGSWRRLGDEYWRSIPNSALHRSSVSQIGGLAALGLTYLRFQFERGLVVCLGCGWRWYTGSHYLQSVGRQFAVTERCAKYRVRDVLMTLMGQ